MTDEKAKKEKPQQTFIWSVDVGKDQDPSALAIIVMTGEPPALYDVRYLRRWELGTPYQGIAKDVSTLAKHHRFLHENCEYLMDRTGVGAPVMEMFQDQGLEEIVGVTITGGFDTTEVDGCHFRVPKRDIVSSLQLVLGGERLRIAEKLPSAEILRDELLNFKVKITKTGMDTYEAWREGDHDDLVLAVGIGIWWGEMKHVRIPKAKPRPRVKYPNRVMGDLPRRRRRT